MKFNNRESKRAVAIVIDGRLDESLIEFLARVLPEDARPSWRADLSSRLGALVQESATVQRLECCVLDALRETMRHEVRREIADEITDGAFSDAMNRIRGVR